MARHNREGIGQDQQGREYRVSYQPDWFYQIKVTRDLDSGRQSTKTLFRNPEPASGEPGSRVRTRVECAELGVDFEVTLEDGGSAVRRVTVETIATKGPEQGQPVSFTISRRRSRRPEG